MKCQWQMIVSVITAEVNSYVNNSLKAESICQQSSKDAAQLCKLGALQ